MSDVKFTFSIGQEVTIVESGRKGKVTGLYLGRQGQQTAVSYADANGASFERYFLDDEIKINEA